MTLNLHPQSPRDTGIGTSFSNFPSRLNILRPLSAPAAAPAQTPAALFASPLFLLTRPRVSLCLGLSFRLTRQTGGLPQSLALHVRSPGSLSSRNSPNPSAPWRLPLTGPPALLSQTRLQLHGDKEVMLKNTPQWGIFIPFFNLICKYDQIILHLLSFNAC